MTNLEIMPREDSQPNSYKPVTRISAEDIEPAEHMPIKAKLYAHQIIGYNMACRVLRITKGGD